MYWPIGAPTAYALEKEPHASRQNQQSGDGVESSGKGVGQQWLNGESVSSGDAGAEADENGSSTGGYGDQSKDEILAADVCRSGYVFATLTYSTLTVWQAKPTVALAVVTRSLRSMKAYGSSTGVCFRPDGQLIVVQTEMGYLITYSVDSDSEVPSYSTQPVGPQITARNGSDGSSNYRRASEVLTHPVSGEADGITEVVLRFRMVIHINAGINKALALEEELMVATRKPAALQCIRWSPEPGSPQTTTELFSRFDWMQKNSLVTDMIHDRPMNLACWITNDGKAYAVQRRKDISDDSEGRKSFQGFCFREPDTDESVAVKAAINARFSLIAVGSLNGAIDVFVVKDYRGNITFSHKLEAPYTAASRGKLNALSFSPDGHCLFAGFEKGWALWSVYGKPLSNSFTTNRAHSEQNGESWLHGAKNAFWICGGCELLIQSMADDRLWILEVARSAGTGVLSAANTLRGLLHSGTSVHIYKGHDLADVTAVSSDLSLWQHVHIPGSYLASQWPIRMASISDDGRYIAIAGRRGFAHYSVSSGRWRKFEDPIAQREFAVRGGMCWFQHFLITAVESSGRYQVRVYSREKALNAGASCAVCVEELSAPVILITVSGADSLLVYTYDNVLLHYVIAPNGSGVKLVQVGQIGFQGIIRAPLRVRAISWILPEEQLEHGDPSRDVVTASLVFLVDGKLVLLQPFIDENGHLKYDMRIIAHNVEYYLLLRDSPATLQSLKQAGTSGSAANGSLFIDHLGHSLRDSLWYFDGTAFQLWSDIHDVLAYAHSELDRDIPAAVQIPVDFYPAAIMVAKGVLGGFDADLVQRSDVNFSFFRQNARTQLFLPQLLRHHLAEYNSPAALHLASSYKHLPYFSHALELLLHNVLDWEVDSPPWPPETAVLPAVISLLSSYPSYLDIIVNCTRKTEPRSWQSLFLHLPPVVELFQQSLAQAKLRTAAGYLLVLHTFEQDSFQTHEFAQLIQQAAAIHNWDLCKEIARFLMGIDQTGMTLRAALAEAGLRNSVNGGIDALSTSQVTPSNNGQTDDAKETSHDRPKTNARRSSVLDYFSLR